QAAPESFFLAFLVALHVGTALSLVAVFWKDWVRIVSAFFRSIAKRKVETSDERLAWLIVIATIPAGILGILLEHELRVVFAKPLAAAIFLIVNGGILAMGELLRRRAEVRAVAIKHGITPNASSRQLDTMEVKEAGVIG